MNSTRVVPKVSGLIYKETQHNNNDQTTMTSLFFHIVSANFSALVPSFLQLLYTSLVEEFTLPLKKNLHRRSDVIVIATEVFYQQWEQTEVGGC